VEKLFQVWTGTNKDFIIAAIEVDRESQLGILDGHHTAVHQSLVKVQDQRHRRRASRLGWKNVGTATGGQRKWWKVLDEEVWVKFFVLVFIRFRWWLGRWLPLAGG
jgi:hypothetical protein